MCQHTCSIYTEHVFIHIYICLVYNIGHVSLMCEDTCMHIAYTEHLFIMCEYTCLVRGHVSWPGSCVLPPYLAARSSLLIPAQKLSAAFTSPRSCSLQTCRQLQPEHCTRHTGCLNKRIWTITIIYKGSPWFNADSVDIFYTATSFIISSRKTFPFKKRKPYDQ